MKFTLTLILALLLLAPGCTDIVISEPVDVDEPSTGKCQIDQDCNDLNTCTANLCIDGQCSFPPAEEICVIDGICSKKDDIAADNACLVCDPSKDDKGWSNRVCDDGDPKTQDSCGTEAGCIFTPIEGCPEGYTGDNCDQCDEGYQDNDEDGFCAVNCDEANLECGPQGSCSDGEGQALCVCNEGHQGENCDACQEGYQDKDQDGACAPNCATAQLACGEEGACDDTSGIALCVCSEGYAGDTCSECGDDYQDEDGDGTCLQSCDKSGIDCGENGACTTGGGIAQCVCDDGYTGTLCDTCAEGYTLVGEMCQQACDQASCGDHAVCGADEECVCVVGYTMTDGACVWTGVIEDSSFDTGVPWVDIHGSSVYGGRAHFIPDCEWSGLKQTVTMPSLQDAEPMRVTIEMTGESPGGCPDGWGCINIPLMASVNGQMVNLQKSYLQAEQTPNDSIGETVQTSFCLGPHAYGGEVEFALFTAPPFGGFICSWGERAVWSVDSLRLEPDTENVCPTPGEIQNSDFEEANGDDWILTENPNKSSAAIEDGVLKIGLQSPCGDAEASQLIQMPAPSDTQGKGVAITFDFKGTEGAPLDLRLDTRRFVRIHGQGMDVDAEKIVACLPAPYLGVLTRLKIMADGGGGQCNDAIDRQFEIDSLAFQTVSGCIGSTLTNGGFEDAGKGHLSWALSAGSHPSLTPPSIQEEVAKGGSFAAALHVDNPCNQVEVSTPVTIPIPTALSGGPALVFHYNYPAHETSNVKVYIKDLYGPDNNPTGFSNNLITLKNTLPSTDGWEQETLCLDSSAYGRRATMAMILHGGGGTCDAAYPEEDAWIDNVKIVYSPDCPAF